MVVHQHLKDQVGDDQRLNGQQSGSPDQKGTQGRQQPLVKCRLTLINEAMSLVINSVHKY